MFAFVTHTPSSAPPCSLCLCSMTPIGLTTANRTQGKPLTKAELICFSHLETEAGPGDSWVNLEGS